MQYSEEELRSMLEENKGVSLILNISANDISGFGTRVVEDPDRFEQTALASEKIQSLRVIIVDVQNEADKKVIHNYTTGDLIYSKFKVSGIRFDNLAFSNKYRIYLIANESGLPQAIREKISVDALPPDGVYPAERSENNLLENIELSDQVNIASGGALISNVSSDLGDGQHVKPIPMTEIFEIITDSRPDNDAEVIKYEMERNFFITRAASKFSFHFNNGHDISDKEMKIKSIKISGLASQEYLFPKNTVYSQNGNEYITTDPNQVYSSLKPSDGMEIIQFGVPTGTFMSTYKFDISKKISEIGTDGLDYNPQIYFPESKGDNGFQCEITLGKDGEDPISSGLIKLPNLNELPRNTHVLINVTFHEIGFEISVETWESGGITEIQM